MTSLIQATYLGGSARDAAFPIAIHPVSGEVYTAGYTVSGNFPGTTGGAQPQSGSPNVYDAFVARMTPSLALNDYTLTATKSGLGSGTVSASDGLINCGSDCNEIYGNNRSITLSAIEDAGTTFTGWSGACSNAAGDCVVIMDANKTATASFSVPVSLTVSKTGGGLGSVTSTEGGVNCGVDCSENYLSGTLVTLTATADASSKFAYWSGACSVGRATCTVTMDAAKSVTAKFNLIR